MMLKKKGYGPLLAATIFFALLAASTVIPQTTASEKCMLGYRAHCSFAPVSTIICLLLSGVACGIRKKKFTENTTKQN